MIASLFFVMNIYLWPCPFSELYPSPTAIIWEQVWLLGTRGQRWTGSGETLRRQTSKISEERLVHLCSSCVIQNSFVLDKVTETRHRECWPVSHSLLPRVVHHIISVSDVFPGPCSRPPHLTSSPPSSFHICSFNNRTLYWMCLIGPIPPFSLLRLYSLLTLPWMWVLITGIHICTVFLIAPQTQWGKMTASRN